MTQLGTGPPQVVGCDVLQAQQDRTTYHTDILRNALAPYRSRPGDCPKDLSFDNACGCHPLIERGFDPFWNQHGANVATLADQVYHCPVPLAHLDFVQLQSHQFRPAKTTTKQHGQHRVVALGSHAIATRMLQHC